VMKHFSCPILLYPYIGSTLRQPMKTITESYGFPVPKNTWRIYSCTDAIKIMGNMLKAITIFPINPKRLFPKCPKTAPIGLATNVHSQIGIPSFNGLFCPGTKKNIDQNTIPNRKITKDAIRHILYKFVWFIFVKYNIPL
ncbi:MAG: hypothetical protein ACQEXQ_17645, partial [Bacillota bacterium]